MTAADHERMRDLTAAYVVGGLDAADRAALEEHLQDCDACREDVVAFAPLPALLGRVDVDDVVPADDGGADVLVAAVLDGEHRLQRSRRRWQWLAGAAAVVAAVLGVVVVQADDGPDRRRDGVPLAVESIDGDVTAAVVADQRDWGTYVHLSADGLPDREVYTMWTVDRAGAWEPVGSWGPTDGGRAQLGCSTSLDVEEIDRIVVTSGRRDDEVLVAR